MEPRKIKAQYTPLQRMRPPGAHVMAEAVQEMFPDAKFAIGQWFIIHL
ncbi:MAG TPA: hypothetical protein VFZ02_00470 [Ktedonobacteraceae bacterium]